MRAETASVVSDSSRAAHVSEILKAIAHPDRLRIVAVLCEAPMHVGAIAAALDKSQPIVSQQLRILRSHRLVAGDRRDGKVYYRILEPQLRTLVRCMERCGTR